TRRFSVERCPKTPSKSSDVSWRTSPIRPKRVPSQSASRLADRSFRSNRAVEGGEGRRKAVTVEDGHMSISRRVFMKHGDIALFSIGLDQLFLARAALGLDHPPPTSTPVH